MCRNIKSPIRVFLVLLSIVCSSAHAEKVQKEKQVKYEFRLYEANTIVADALQKRLLQGGEVAIEANKMLPKLIKKNRMKLLETLEGDLALVKNRCSKAMRSSDKDYDIVYGHDLESNFKERGNLPQGLCIEMEVQSGHREKKTSPLYFSSELQVKYVSKNGELFTTRDTRLSLTYESGVPTLLCRWQEGDSNFILVGRLGAKFTKQPEEGRFPQFTEQKNIYIDSVVFSKQKVEMEEKSKSCRCRIVCVSSPGVTFIANVYRSYKFNEFENKPKSGYIKHVLKGDGVKFCLSSSINSKVVSVDGYIEHRQKLPGYISGKFSFQRLKILKHKLERENRKIEKGGKSHFEFPVVTRKEVKVDRTPWTVSIKPIVYSLKRYYYESDVQK